MKRYAPIIEAWFVLATILTIAIASLYVSGVIALRAWWYVFTPFAIIGMAWAIIALFVGLDALARRVARRGL